MATEKPAAKLTKLFGIKEVNGLYQLVVVKADLEKEVISEIKLQDPIGLESARVQFKVEVVRSVIEGSLD